MRIKAIIISFFVSFLILMGTCNAQENSSVGISFSENVTVIHEHKPTGVFSVEFNYSPEEDTAENLRILYILGSNTEGVWISETYPGNYTLDTQGTFEPGTFKCIIVLDGNDVIMAKKGYLRHDDELGEYVVKTYDIHPDSPGLEKYLEIYGIGN